MKIRVLVLKKGKKFSLHIQRLFIYFLLNNLVSSFFHINFLSFRELKDEHIYAEIELIHVK